MGEKMDARSAEDSVLKSPTCSIARPERESPFRKTGGTESGRSEEGDGSKGEGTVSDNSACFKGQPLPRSGAEGRVTSLYRNSSENPDTRSPTSSIQSPGESYEVETNAAVLARRLKQIQYGKTTTEYSHYLQAVPRDQRRDFHPRTPNMTRKYSRRAWEGLIKQWRLHLHSWSQHPPPFKKRQGTFSE